VDSPGDHALDRGPGPYDPHSRAHDRDHEQGAERDQEAHPEERPRANDQGGCCLNCCHRIESVRFPNEKSTMDLPTIEIASKADHDRAIATLLLGFSSDPLTRWFWPEAKDYLQSAPVFDAFGGNAVEAGTAFVSAGFEGAALWLPPGIAPDEERMAEFLQKTVASEIVEDVFSVLEKMDECHPDEDVWYLPLVAVDPAHQGKGIGSALMKQPCNVVMKQAVPPILNLPIQEISLCMKGMVLRRWDRYR
jgi:GNAT superfamily N-acetyltransferase